MVGLFNPGRLLITANAKEEIPDITIHQALKIHLQGDWGDMCKEDKDSNNAALKDGDRIFSSYEINGFKFWIITESDRSATTVLLPSDY